MFSSVFVVLALILSIGFSGILAVALLTYIRRTWQLIRGESDGSIQHRILDGVDQIHARMDFLQERMKRLEKALQDGDARLGLPPKDSGTHEPK